MSVLRRGRGVGEAEGVNVGVNEVGDAVVGAAVVVVVVVVVVVAMVPHAAARLLLVVVVSSSSFLASTELISTGVYSVGSVVADEEVV